MKENKNISYCHECRVNNGFKRKDRGSHTSTVKKCESCGKRRSILSDRHWVIEYPNGMVLQ